MARDDERRVFHPREQVPSIRDLPDPGHSAQPKQGPCGGKTTFLTCSKSQIFVRLRKAMDFLSPQKTVGIQQVCDTCQQHQGPQGV